MVIKFADEIIKEIKKRQFSIKKGYFTGEEFEKWLRKKKKRTFHNIK